MDQIHVIRHKTLIEGQSVRQVAKDIGVSRNTVKKYLGMSAPVRKPREQQPGPVLSKVAPRVEQLLAAWQTRTTKKQRITGRRVYRELVAEGFHVGYTTVREYIREYRRQRQEVYIPLIHRPGDSAQVDFFEVTVEENGQQRKVWKFLARLMYSGRDFMWLYDQCDQLAFLDGHVRAFAHWQGVPARLVYDNLSSAVQRRVKGEVERRLTERMQALASHYLFEPCFARVGEGHDKGGVEARGKGIRWQHLTPIPRGTSLRQLSEALLQEVEQAAIQPGAAGRSILDKFQEEQPLLRPLPPVAFDVRRVEVLSVSRQALIQWDGVQYSVPSAWACLAVTVGVGVEDLRVTCSQETITVAKRGRGRPQVQYRHYLKELAHKPQAVRQVAPELMAELGEPYQELWELLVRTYRPREAARVMAKLLGALHAQGETSVQAALARLLPLMTDPPPAAGPPALVRIPIPGTLQSYHIESGQAADYDWLLAGGGQ